ncbi:universal stress protein [Natrialba asiatica]|uniref:UspA domain protein n=1 Tax=Natrialba asiatica (strain ATCC 700177 / DSM 12278 / JCM 9576 / FERM P-10747 / NBRC 102637 / 172P1) TaxID=29540 RepID=M0B3E9_NATA1|nr:universal stress protein [Natrialba asiatica]ELZ05431.1 UspA domain protein [Natrialba asiatica DSM 12278]
MQRALVVIDDTDAHRRLLTEAGQFARNGAAELVVFAWTTPEAAEDGNDAIEWVEEMEGTTFEDTDATAMTRQFAREFSDDALSGVDADVDVETEVVITPDDERDDAILSAADRQGCDHVFLVGQKRSPTGKAIFGNIAQRVLLNFDGPVTVMME